MPTYLNVAQILVSLTIILVILAQVKEGGGGLFGSAQSSVRTPAGVGKDPVPVHHRSVCHLPRNVHPESLGGLAVIPCNKSDSTTVAPPIVLTTDFGAASTYAGVLHGVVLRINSSATIIDLTHQIQPQNIRQASFILGLQLSLLSQRLHSRRGGRPRSWDHT